VQLPATIEEAIALNAIGPASMSVGGESVTQKNIAELIEADRYLATKRAEQNRAPGIRFFKFVPGGCG
jgi:hypothetical protein